MLMRKTYSTIPPAATPRPVSLRARPFLFISAFLVFHQAVATTSLVPTYYFFSATDSATSLLAGPYAAWVLRQPAPWPLAPRGSDQKMEDVVERLLRSSVSRGWGLWSRWRESKGRPAADTEGAAVAEEVIEGLEGHQPGWRDRVVGGVQSARTRWAERKAGAGALPEVEGNAQPDGLAQNQTWRAKAAETASDIKLKDAMNLAAAYLVVKTLFPLRLGASLYFAPKIARMLARRW